MKKQIIEHKMKLIMLDIPVIGRQIEFSIGKNAQDNFNIIDSAKPNDIWFHLFNAPSCHIIASLPENITKEEKKYIIKQGAILCKRYSNMASRKNVFIIYSSIENIIKSKPVGTVEFRDYSKTNIIEI
jgi:hypothetical protein